MNSILIAWLVAAAVLVFVAIALGKVVRQAPLGILIDNRGRYSLTQLQLVLWSVVVISLIAGVAIGRVFANAAGAALGFDVPRQLLIVMGISLGSTATAATIKASKDAANPARVAASDKDGDKPRLLQIFLQEEGEYADRVVDVAKYQNFWITLVVVLAYLALAVSELAEHGADLKALPGFSDTLLVLLGVSHAGYLAGKLPTPDGEPKGLTVALRKLGAVPAREPAAAAAAAPRPTYTPRNP